MQYIILVIVLLADQVTKLVIKSGFLVNESLPVVENIFHITYVQNTGAAFSLFTGQRYLLIGVTGTVLFAMFIYMLVKGRKKSACLRIALAMIIAGGVGNLIDRISYGYVVDFLDFRVWPVFNVADISVSIGCVLLVIYVIFIDGRQKKDDGE